MSGCIIACRDKYFLTSERLTEINYKITGLPKHCCRVAIEAVISPLAGNRHTEQGMDFSAPHILL